jgi:hypothetical protein
VSYLLGNVVGVMTESAAEAASFSHPTSLGNIKKILMFFIARGVGVKQLGFNFQFSIYHYFYYSSDRCFVIWNSAYF